MAILVSFAMAQKLFVVGQKNMMYIIKMPLTAKILDEP